MASRFGEDVRVVELEVVDDGDLRQVVDELAALVEERGVVFVALDDEPLAVGEPRALAEVVRDAADEEARIQPVVLEHPRQQRRRGGLAVRAGNDERAFAANEELLEQFRQRAIAQLVVEHEFRFRVAARILGIQVDRGLLVRGQQRPIGGACDLRLEGLLGFRQQFGLGQQVDNRPRHHLGAGDSALMSDGGRLCDRRRPMVKRNARDVGGKCDPAVGHCPGDVPRIVGRGALHGGPERLQPGF